MNFLLRLSISCLLLVCACGLPTLRVPQCPTPPPSPSDDWRKFPTAVIPHFVLASGNVNATQQTIVYMCSTQDDLYVKFDCIDDNIYSPYTMCNEPLFRHDVVELFLGPPGTATPTQYLELEVSPTNALFAARITNPSGSCSGISDQLLDCDGTGIKYEARMHQKASHWYAYLRIPWRLITSSLGLESEAASSIRANFYRIDTPLGGAKEYTCWSSTLTSPACFHRPQYFGTLTF